MYRFAEVGKVFTMMAYWAVLGVGFLQTWQPSASVSTYATVTARAWGASLLIGSACGLWSTVRGTWPGEYVGALTLSIAFLIYSLGVFITPPYDTGRASLGLVLLMVALLFAARHRVVSAVRKTRAAEAQQRESEGAD